MRKLKTFYTSFNKRYMIPNWMCIGAPKAGTTSLYSALKTHPEIWVPECKETHFFSSPDYYNGMDWYLKTYFSGAKKNRSVGELTPKYLRQKGVPERINKHINKDIKFLVILRNPVDRAWSHYCHAYDRFRHVQFRPTEDLTFDEALKVEPDRLRQSNEYGWTHGMFLAYFYTGLYAQHLKNWFGVFSRRKFLIITLEDLIENTAYTLDKITNHLKIAPFNPHPHFRKTNTYSKPGLTESTRKMLIKRYRPHIKELENLLGRRFSSWYNDI